MIDTKQKAKYILEDYAEYYSQVDLEQLAKYLDEIKAEAYKEFAERCKKRASMYGFGDKSGVWVNTKDIDNLLKELVGEDK